MLCAESECDDADESGNVVRDENSSGTVVVDVDVYGG